MSTDYRFSVAPMMDWTDRHCRYFHRLLSKRARLYTEMVVADAVVFGERGRLLEFNHSEHPVALQIGGSEPSRLAEAAKIGEQFGYDEINLNVGCPSDRVQSGTFGACLMRTPTVVADCIDAMRRSVSIPVTVKCRIGVDDQDPTETLPAFVHECAQAGAGVFIVHARKAWLQGLSPKDNREIPPLDYELVAKVKSANPELTIVLNGGITSIDQCHDHLECFDGVMLGRSAYQQPRLLTHVDQEFFGDRGTPSSVEAVVDHMDAYVQQQARQDVRPNAIVRHIQGLAHGLPGARRWRRLLTEQGTNTPADILRTAYEAVADEWSASLAA